MSEQLYCDHQDCLEFADVTKTLPDGCSVNCCEMHKDYFHATDVINHGDGAAPGVYFHGHSIVYDNFPS